MAMVSYVWLLGGRVVATSQLRGVHPNSGRMCVIVGWRATHQRSSGRTATSRIFQTATSCCSSSPLRTSKPTRRRRADRVVDAGALVPMMGLMAAAGLEQGGDVNRRYWGFTGRWECVCNQRDGGCCNPSAPTTTLQPAAHTAQRHCWVVVGPAAPRAQPTVGTAATMAGGRRGSGGGGGMQRL